VSLTVSRAKLTSDKKQYVNFLKKTSISAMISREYKLTAFYFPGFTKTAIFCIVGFFLRFASQRPSSLGFDSTLGKNEVLR